MEAGHLISYTESIENEDFSGFIVAVLGKQTRNTAALDAKK